MDYTGSKISLQEDDVPTLFLVVEAMLMPPFRRTLAVTWTSTTMVYLGSKRDVGWDTDGTQLTGYRHKLDFLSQMTDYFD